MLSRFGANTVGHSGRALFGNTPAASMSRLLNCNSQSQTRFSSSESQLNIPHLPPPWQISNLRQREQHAFAEHGPNYLEHMYKTHQRHALHRARGRERFARYMKGQFGEDWYSAMKEIARIKDERLLPKQTELAQRRKDLAAQFEAALHARRDKQPDYKPGEVGRLNRELGLVKQEQRNLSLADRAIIDQIREELVQSRGVVTGQSPTSGA